MSTPNFKTQKLFNLYAAEMSYIDEDGEEYFDDYLFEDVNNYLYLEINNKLKFFDIKLESGYYSGVQTIVDEIGLLHNCYDSPLDLLKYYNDFDGKEIYAAYGFNKYILAKKIKAEINYINNKLLPQLKDWGFKHLVETARFSNGEAVYSVVA